MADRVFTGDLLRKAKAKIGEYPQSRSAILPLVHMLQAAVGYATRDGLREIAELLGLTPAEVLGTASFYTMFKLEPVGENLVSVCTGPTCQMLRGEEVFENVSEHFGVEDLETTSDGNVTVEEVECLAACGGAPCLQVNYRYFEYVDPEAAPELVDDVVARGLDTVFGERGSIRAPLPPFTPEQLAELSADNPPEVSTSDLKASGELHTPSDGGAEGGDG